jgi:plastocyanin
MLISHLIPRSRRLPVAVWAIIPLLAMAACGPSASPSPVETAAVGGDTTVIITGTSFSDDITIPAGSSVTFVNADGFDHTVTNGVDGVAATGALFDVSLGAGASSDPIVFDTPGVYGVTCKIHSTMNMTITVE